MRREFFLAEAEVGNYLGNYLGNFGADDELMEPLSTENTTILARPERLVFSVPEAAELLGISRALGYELVARGELPSIRLGRRRVVPRVALLALVGARPAD